jgi:hypothetical protein
MNSRSSSPCTPITQKALHDTYEAPDEPPRPKGARMAQSCWRFELDVLDREAGR